jgi:hypothetical protein
VKRADEPDRHTLTLLIQLFGREVLDRLAASGYDREDAIASAGAERLASTSGVSLPLAQRIVAVVEEARAGRPGTSATARKASRRPRREARRAKTPGVETAPRGATVRETEAPAEFDLESADAFVDDVALVTWMGFSSKTPSGRLSFSVADRILDPGRPVTPASDEPPVPKEPDPPAALAPSTPQRRTLPGSFWSFGRPGEHARPGGTARRRDRDDH